MKTILVPTDYSAISANAMNFAIELALKLGSKIILFHVLPIPIPTADLPILTVAEEIEKAGEKRIQVLKEEIRSRTNGKLAVETVTRIGADISMEISTEILENGAGLVVMGVTGAGNLANVLIGSNTTSLMSKTKCPVLVIPGDARYAPLKKITFACDSDESLPEKFLNTLAPLQEAFHPQFLVMHIQKQSKHVLVEREAHFSKRVLTALAPYHPEYYFPVAESIETAVDEFIKQHDANLLVMVPHERNLLADLFHFSNTKKMAFHTHIPLLSIHE